MIEFPRSPPLSHYFGIDETICTHAQCHKHSPYKSRWESRKHLRHLPSSKKDLLVLTSKEVLTRQKDKINTFQSLFIRNATFERMHLEKNICHVSYSPPHLVAPWINCASLGFPSSVSNSYIVWLKLTNSLRKGDDEKAEHVKLLNFY